EFDDDLLAPAQPGRIRKEYVLLDLHSDSRCGKLPGLAIGCRHQDALRIGRGEHDGRVDMEAGDRWQDTLPWPGIVGDEETVMTLDLVTLAAETDFALMAIAEFPQISVMGGPQPVIAMGVFP